MPGTYRPWRGSLLPLGRVAALFFGGGFATQREQAPSPQVRASSSTRFKRLLSAAPFAAKASGILPRFVMPCGVRRFETRTYDLPVQRLRF